MKRKSQTRTERSGSKVVALPALPGVPRVPVFPPDPRQSTYLRIRASLAEQMGGKMHVSGASRMSGFPAASIDLGALQDAVGKGVSRFTATQLRRRWLVDVREWVQRTVLDWVQRVKMVTVKLFANGVHITIHTQDDRGYYRYELDVFPRA